MNIAVFAHSRATQTVLAFHRVKIMARVLHACLDPVVAINRRVLIGGGVLTLIMLGESTLAFVRPFG